MTEIEASGGNLTNEMMKTIQQPNTLHVKLVQSILEATKISFYDNQGYINAKDLQI